MKKSLFLTALLLSMSAIAANKPEFAYVPDAKTAIAIAEAVMVPIYGAEAIRREQPFTATLVDGVWIVTGNQHCTDPLGCAGGGVAEARIAKKDGRIIVVFRGK